MQNASVYFFALFWNIFTKGNVYSLYFFSIYNSAQSSFSSYLINFVFTMVESGKIIYNSLIGSNYSSGKRQWAYVSIKPSFDMQ